MVSAYRFLCFVVAYRGGKCAHLDCQIFAESARIFSFDLSDGQLYLSVIDIALKLFSWLMFLKDDKQRPTSF